MTPSRRLAALGKDSTFVLAQVEATLPTPTPPAPPALRGVSQCGRQADESLEQQLQRVTAHRDLLERQALRDPLTGLLNRRAVADRLGAELARAEREGQPFSLVALDIDFFKQINDLCGHAAGDGLLQTMAQRISVGVRPGDISGRVGGDEFMLGLVNTDARAATDVLSRIGSEVDALESAPGQPSLSFSAGIAEFPRHAAVMEELMERADEALFRAKATGRHRVNVYSSGSDVGRLPELGSAERHQRYLQNTVDALARAIDARNGYTHLHSHAVASYAVSLARALGMDGEHVELVRRSGVLHDVGKIGVPDAVLWKKGTLDADEMALMRRHSATGHDILLGAGLPEIAEWVGHLHERFDGGGYPDGLHGEAIPLESRLLAVVDAFDAMTSPRLYRRPLEVEDALSELEDGAGRQFDGDLVSGFVELVRGGGVELHLRRPEPEQPRT